MEPTPQYTYEQINAILTRTAIENEKFARESRKRSAELDRKLDKLSEMYNGFAKNTGEAVEHFFFNYFERVLKIGTIEFDKIKLHMESMNAEYDIVLSNGKYIGIIECKHKFHPKDLEYFIFESLPKFKSEFPKYQNSKIVAGIATYVLVEDTKKLALEHGLYIYTQLAEKVKILNSKDFKAKYY